MASFYLKLPGLELTFISLSIINYFSELNFPNLKIIQILISLANINYLSMLNFQSLNYLELHYQKHPTL
jgi:hypothetical protein